MASRPLPLLRRGRRVLGARGDGADALRDRRGRGADVRAREASRDARASTSPTRRSAAGSSPASPTCSASRRASPATRRTCSPPGASCSSGSPSVDPVVLVFEDMQWADAGLLDFLEYLLDWSRNHPIFVLSLARPELAEKHPTWGAGKRSCHLALPRAALRARRWRSCSTGSFPGCRRSCASQILERAEGVPLYAVETVRMLLDRGLLAQDGNVYRPTGPIETLEVPETLHALVAARLDGLTAEERRLVQDAAVLGKTFTQAGPRRAHRARRGRARAAARVARPQGGALDPGRSALTRARPVRVPAGHRQARRLRDALEARAQGQAPRGGAVPGDASGARTRTRSSRSSPPTTSTPTAPRPDAEDADEIKATAREMLVRAAERASSLGATAEAQRAYERGDRADRRPARPGGAARARRDRGRARVPGQRRRSATSSDAIELFEAPAPRIRRRGSPPGLPRSCGNGDVSRRDREPGARVRGALTGRAGRGPRHARRPARTLLVLRRRVRASRRSGSRLRSISPRRSCCRRSSRRR